MKTCTKCKIVKDFSDFNRDRTTKSGLYPSCKLCISLRPYKNDPARKMLYDKEYRKHNMVRKIKNTYSISMEEAQSLYEKAHNLCEICGKSETARSSHGDKLLRRLAIDHDHLTGKVRGVLCGRCNKGLGYFKDSVNNLTKAASYLLKNS